MKGRLERFVLKTPLDFDYVINSAVDICGSSRRDVFVVGGYFKLREYFRIKKAIKALNPEINVSYRVRRPKSKAPYSETPYFIEVDCFKFKN